MLSRHLRNHAQRVRLAKSLHAEKAARLRWVQWCWAHLKRDFQALVDSSDGQAKRLGHGVLRPVAAMFSLWHRVHDGTLSRSAFQTQLQPIRQEVEALLLRGMFSG